MTADDPHGGLTCWECRPYVESYTPCGDHPELMLWHIVCRECGKTLSEPFTSESKARDWLRLRLQMEADKDLPDDEYWGYG